MGKRKKPVIAGKMPALQCVRGIYSQALSVLRRQKELFQ